MHELISAGTGRPVGDVVVHWQSAFGLIIIEVRGGRTFVNGDLVERSTTLALQRSISLQGFD